MTLLELYQNCEENNVDVSYFPMRKTKALAFPEGLIAIDVDKIENTAEEKEVVAHELGHIETGSFYNAYSSLDIRAKHEYRAEKHAIKKLVPLDELKEAIKCGIIESWDLAEYFDVTDEFMKKAINYYKNNMLFQYY